MADGKITFRTDLDNKDLEKELKSVQRQIEKATESKGKATAGRLQLLEDAKELGARLDEAKAKLFELQSSQSASPAAISEQKEEVSALEKEWNSINAKIERYEQIIKQENVQIQEGMERAGELRAQMSDASGKLRDMMDAAGKGADSLKKRIVSLASRVFVFTLITKALRAARDYFGGLLSKNQEFQGELAKLRAALATAFQPLYEVAVPVLTTILRLLTQIVSVAASVISSLFGKSVQQSAKNAAALNKEADAIGGVGSAAEDAKKQLAGFDEINQLSADTGGGGGGGSTQQMDFSDLENGIQISDQLKDILEMVGLIAAGLALWKISEFLPGTLGTIALKLGGILIAIGGIALAIYGVTDAWNNGVNWQNAAEILLGVTAAAGGLYLVFGKMGAGIALTVGGIAMLVTGFKDVMENGFNLENTLLTLAGIIATGLGITLLTGSFIPLLIAGIAALLLAITVLTGQGGQLIDGLKLVFKGFLDFFTGVFTGDWDLAWQGLKDIAKGGLNTIIAVVNGLIIAAVAGINALFRVISFDISLPGGKSIGIHLPELTPPQIPYLAQGAVIPPNAPFMAMLGDQRNGNNIEAPEDLIRRIVREESGGGNDNIVELLEQLIAVVGSIKVGDDVIGRAATRYQRAQSRKMGV